MSNKYVRYTTPVGTARFPKLNEPDTFKGNSAYKVDLIITEEEANSITQKLEAEFPDLMARGINTPIQQTRNGKDDDAPMVWILRAKSGQTDRPMRMFDCNPKSNGGPRPITVNVGPGSRIRLSVSFGSNHEDYITAYLNSVQVGELAEMGSGFDDIEGGFVDDSIEAVNGDFV